MKMLFKVHIFEVFSGAQSWIWKEMRPENCFETNDDIDNNIVQNCKFYMIREIVLWSDVLRERELGFGVDVLRFSTSESLRSQHATRF